MKIVRIIAQGSDREIVVFESGLPKLVVGLS